MIKVAHIVEDLKIGGLERIIENIVMSLDSKQFETYVLCLSGGGAIAEKLVAYKKNIEILNIKNYHNPLSLLKVVAWLKRKKIDIVHTHAYSAGVLGRVAAIIARVSYIFHHVHSTYSYLYKRNLLIEKCLSKFTKKVICCSNAVMRFVLEKEGISEDKLVVIYNGIPETKTQKASAVKGLREGLDIPRDSSVIGCVASLTQHKGHCYLLEALQKIDDAYLLLIGDGPLRRKLVGKASTLNITSKIIFAGSKIDVAPYIQIMDIVVLPSTEVEGLGMSLIEAMALSKPVIGTNIGGIPEVVSDGRTGILVKPNDSSELRDSIKKLLQSPTLMRNMGINGKNRYLKLFTINQMIQSIESLYIGVNRKNNIIYSKKGLEKKEDD